MRKTKIVCTLGPASSDADTINRMIDAGMNVARFNFSHGDRADHLKLFELVDGIRTRRGLPIGTMLDTKGPEIRLGVFGSGRVTLAADSEFSLSCAEEEFLGDEHRVSVSHKGLCKDVVPGSRILIDDGLVELSVTEVRGEEIVCRVINGGDISDRKGVNVPDILLSIPYVSEKDRGDIIFALKTGFDFIAPSFVSTADDILQIRKIIEEYGEKSSIKIISKIENYEGVKNIDEILRVSDGIMVARGDMGVEIPLEDVPIHQKVLIKKAYEAGKHVITATQMLDSMIKNPRPTRAEANDIANAIYDGTSAIMLSGESAMGAYPVESVLTMAKIAERIESDINYRERFLKRRSYGSSDVTNAISHATCTTAYDLGVAAIVTVTQSGHTARMCSRFRPEMPIIACTPDFGIFYSLSISWGVCPLIMPLEKDTDTLFASAEKAALSAGYLKSGDITVITAGVPLGVPGTTNLLKVQVVGDILVSGKGLNSFKKVGNICVAKDESQALLNFKQNDILVVPKISEGLLPLLKKASALVSECEGLSQPAVAAVRDFNIPIIVHAAGATSVLKNGIAAVADSERGLVCNAAAHGNKFH